MRLEVREWLIGKDRPYHGSSGAAPSRFVCAGLSTERCISASTVVSL
jgi:hypothetical protein